MVDQGNSSTTPLNMAEVFTGTPVDCSGFALIVVFLHAEPSNAECMLDMQFSSDSVNWDRTVPLDNNGNTVPIPTTEPPHTLVPVGRYFRVVVTNGAVANFTALRLQTLLLPVAGKGLTSRVDQVIGSTADVDNVRVLNEPMVDNSRGVVTSRQTIHKFGKNTSVGTTREDVWSGGGSYTGWLTAADTLRVQAGGNAADDIAGAGARTVRLLFADANWSHIEEELDLAGASASAATASTGCRLLRAWVTDCGTYGAANTGDVTIETSGGIVVGRITADVGQTELSMYTIPAGFTGYVRRISANTGGGKAATVTFWRRQDADVAAAPFTSKRILHTFDELDGATEETFTSLTPLPAKTDIWATAAAASGTTPVDVDYDILLVQD